MSQELKTKTKLTKAIIPRFNAGQVAKMLETSRDIIRKAVKRKLLKGQRMGKLPKYSEQDIMDYLERIRPDAPSGPEIDNDLPYGNITITPGIEAPGAKKKITKQ